MKIIGALVSVYFLLSGYCPTQMDMSSGAEMQNCPVEECMAENPSYFVNASFFELKLPLKESSMGVSFKFPPEHHYGDPFLIDRSPPGSSLSRDIQTTVLRI